MGRKAYHGTAKDQNGRVIYSATVNVYTAGTTTAATCYASEAGAALSGGATTSDAYGAFEFWVDSGDYTQDQEFKVVISKSGYSSVTYDYIHIPGFGLETTDSPTFSSLTIINDITADGCALDDLTASQAVMTNGSKVLVSADYLDQAVKIASSPTFAGATFSGLTASVPVWTSAAKALVSVSTRFKVGSITRDLSAADGAVAETGVGFQPSVVIFMGAVAGSGMLSLGFDSSAAAYSIADNREGTAGAYYTASTSLCFYVSAGVKSNGTISSWSADGFSITWAKTGSPAGTANVFYLAIR
uniref:Tail protein n=1 Tax=viral metagenome TaxID=1070528 RepID=A0A6H1Z9G6_9ZZZZ